MAAAASDLIMEVGTPGTATNLAGSGYAIAGTSMTVVSTSNWPTATGAPFAVDVVEIVNGAEVRVEGSYNEFVGVVTSATTIGSVVQTFGTPQNYAAGATTRVYIPVTSTRENRLAQAMVMQHKQDGTHANTITTNVINENTAAAGVTADGVLHKDGTIQTAGALSPVYTANPYKFRVSRNAAANTGNNAYAAIAFDVEQFDTGNNVASGVFTAPVSGFYQFNWTATATLSAGADETFIAALFINGAEYTRGNSISYRNLQGSGGSDLVQLTAAQTVDVRVFAPTTRALSVGNTTHNRFSGFMVSAT
jgi:hypothetical protein